MELSRRRFLERAGTAAGVVNLARGAARNASIILDPVDKVAQAPAVVWAAGELKAALEARGIATRLRDRLADAAPGELCVVAGAGRAGVAAAPEALAMRAETIAAREVLSVGGHDARGLVYALLELADRARHADDAAAALTIRRPVSERPANRIRAVSRLFCSDVEDKGWFNDREMWPRYLTLLASQRFNRFHLALGISYDFLRQASDGYFLFPYPFLLPVEGYRVRVPQLGDDERDRNLAALRFISEQAVARGIEFQLGLWMHGYEWIDSPNPNYTVEGLTRETHGPYCRDAVRTLLRALPAVSGVTFRIHGESGVEEGSYDFWKMVFAGVAACGRTVEIDMHAKGMDQTMLDLAVGTGLPVKVSPKYWAEHMGLPYHQADIRELERPQPGRSATGLMKFSGGSRSFLRYGYGDLLREDRKWGVLHRIWPGTQRLLLWGDPLTAAAHSRAFSFCGSDGVDIMEPLSFKGRRGSGIAGDRCAYADASLRPRWDWEKYEYTYRIWGRLVYNPGADPESWRRYLGRHIGDAAEAEAAIANASRILPIVTTAHGASAGNNTYWPEVYLNQPIVDASNSGPYTDSPAPRVFGNVSPLDPQLFSRINDCADELLQGAPGAKYSPIEVAVWLEDYAAAAALHLARLETHATGKTRPEYRRFAIDVELECGIGRFFAAKFRAGVLYRVYEQTGERAALEESLKAYRLARGQFSSVANRAKGVYMADITVGERPQLRGHWLDRLPAMDADIERMAQKLERAKPSSNSSAQAAIRYALSRPRRPLANCAHTPPPHFSVREPVAVDLKPGGAPASVWLHYRHVTQAERWESGEMEKRSGQYRGIIPSSYTDCAYPLEYYFEIREARGALLYPGLGPELTSQPYFLLRRG